MYARYCALRDEKGVKDADVSRNTGIPKSTFSDWKKGKSSPKQDKLKKLADYFGVSVEYLMTGKEPSVDYVYNEEWAEFLVDLVKSDDPERIKRIISYYRCLDESQKDMMETFLKTLSENVNEK